MNELISEYAIAVLITFAPGIDAQHERYIFLPDMQTCYRRLITESEIETANISEASCISASPAKTDTAELSEIKAIARAYLDGDYGAI